MEQQRKDIVKIIHSASADIKRALPKVVPIDRFIRIAQSVVSTNPALQKCSPASILGSLMTGAQLGLEMNTPLGHAYLIPYGNTCTFQIGYQGLIALAYRTGLYKTIYAMDVYEDDDFEYEYGLSPRLHHVPSPHRDVTDKPTHYYAVFKLVNGGEDFRVMSRAEVEAHARKYSKAYTSKSSGWSTDFDAMAKKTVLKRLLKYAPIAVEAQEAIAHDNRAYRLEREKVVVDVDYKDYEEDRVEDKKPELADAIDDLLST